MLTSPARKPKTKSKTLDDLAAIPDDGVTRYLIDGEIREYPREGMEQEPETMSTRSPEHCEAEAAIAHWTRAWAFARSPRWTVASGEARVRLSKRPESIVGIDVAVFDPTVRIVRRGNFSFYDGPPRVAVEIMSPSDSFAKISDKLESYRKAKVPLVWFVDTFDQSIKAYYRGKPPMLATIVDVLEGNGVLPGLRIPVKDIFAR